MHFSQGFEVPFSNHEDYLGTNVFPTESNSKTEDCGPTKPAKCAKTDKNVIEPNNYYTKPENYGKEVYIAALDYIWYGSDRLQCDGVLEMIDEQLIRQFHSAPNIVFPSDHMLMKAEFHFL